MSKFRTLVLASSAIAMARIGSAAPQIEVGSNGSHGAFDAAARDTNNDGIVIVDLAAEGNYDPANWMVVFHFTSVNIQAGKEVRFTNHPSRAPLVWLSQGNIDIRGTINLNGSNSSYSIWAEGGPGGFRGGIGTNNNSGGWNASSGFGPGGGFHHQTQVDAHGTGGSYATLGNRPATSYPLGATYNNPGIFQLIGGSGGGGARNDGLGAYRPGGGGGGGAILLASNQGVAVYDSAKIMANGGGSFGNHLFGGDGSGGAIRIVADSVSLRPLGVIQAVGGQGGYGGGAGRIRIETNVPDLQASTSPPYSLQASASDLILVPSGAPTVRVVEVAAIPVAADPRSSFFGSADISLPASGAKTVIIQTDNVPLNSVVYLRVTRAQGAAYEVQVTNPLVSTGATTAETSISIPLENGITALQARVVLGV